MAYPHYRSQFGDTTFTKVFVGGLAWETPTEEMRKYFEQFGDILEAVIITDKNTGKSKGYGFVTFRDPESARRACSDPNPVIDGRRANCNIASLGRPRPSPPRGRGTFQGGGGAGAVQGAASYSGVPAAIAPPAPPPLLYPQPYGYPTYTPDYGYHQATLYNTQIQQAQYYQQLYGPSSSTMASPYYYGYSMQAPRGTFSTPQAHRLPAGPSYIYYPTTPIEGSSAFRPPYQPATLRPSPSDSQTQQRTSSETTTSGAVITSESSNTQGKN
ncbi:hypothetical protein RIF29_16899 [Crotalaria pallida]|uniref:RRM domain-containing protein n=1 Tax=Crotalaria pallida TaxID=3830 RepID=A0AAN9FG28_CROPI